MGSRFANCSDRLLQLGLQAALSVILPLLASPVVADELKFEDVTQQAGLSDALAGLLGHGAAWGDFDGDGRPDLFVGGFCDRPDAEYAPANAPVPTRLFHNQGHGRFKLVKTPEVQFHGRTSGAVFADLNLDGRPELYVANNARPVRPGSRSRGPVQDAAKTLRSRLISPLATGFKDVTDSSGASPESLLSARNVAVFDWDQDGLLDLFVIEDRFIRQPGSVLLRNLGDLRFEDVTAEAGLPTDVYGLGHAAADVNGDGRTDIFVAHSNRFFLSQADGTFREFESLTETLKWEPLHNEDWPCGAALADLNRDGRLDLVLAVHGEPARNRVYLNQGLKEGVPKFRDVTELCGFPDSVPVKCPHVEVQDFDNDGWPDIYFSAGWLDGPDQLVPLVFRNFGPGPNGIPRFVAPREVRSPMVYFPAGPSADFDQDGRVDLFLVNWFQDNRCRLLRNASAKGQGQGHWLQVVIGENPSAGIGSQVNLLITNDSGAQALLATQQLYMGSGYASGRLPALHFGLGSATEVTVEVVFPDGRRVRRTQVAADQRVVIPVP